MNKFATFCTLSAGLCTTLSLAQAAETSNASYAVADIPEELRIVGGESTKTCHFPSTVWIGSCTGTLVHPQVLTTANHCLRGSSQNVTVTFGESGRASYKVKAKCKAYKGGSSAPPGGDFAYCVLDEPVNDVPIVPILMGCELDALVKDQEIVLVGFGATRNGGRDAGTKRQVVTPVHDGPGKAGVPDKEILLGHSKKGACNGDSGGPAFIDLRTVDAFKDKKGAGWRVFGVTSRKGPGGGNCASTSAYGLIPKVVDWIEQESGIDVTPCFDADGTWNPSEDCKGFPDPEAGGSWQACDAGERSGWSHTCGDNPHDTDSEGGDGEEDKKSKEGEDDEKPEGEDEESSGDGGDDGEGSGEGEDEDASEEQSEGSEEQGSEGDEESDDNASEDDASAKSEGSSGDEGSDKKGGCSVSETPAPWTAAGLGLLGLLWFKRRER